MTLRKTYLVPAADYDASRLHSKPPQQPVKPRPRVRTGRAAKRGRTDNRYPHYKWVSLRKELLEADINEAEMDKWEVGVHEFTCHPINVGTFASLAVVSAQIAFFYCDLMSPHLVGSQYVPCLRSFVHPTTYCNNIFEKVYYVPVEKRRF